MAWYIGNATIVARIATIQAIYSRREIPFDVLTGLRVISGFEGLVYVSVLLARI
jgi:hypothetical protein